MKLIDKDIVLAKIERRMQALHPTNTHQMQVGEKMDRDVLMWLNALTWVKNVLNILEVKEVDLEKEIDIYYNWLPGRRDDIAIIAKHFFYLGLKTQKGEEI